GNMNIKIATYAMIILAGFLSREVTASNTPDSALTIDEAGNTKFAGNVTVSGEANFENKITILNSATRSLF
ncbi:MAG: hypothetical protein NT153_12580, partial [Bacteroidetes bacterium]|nr:hypothetical protein [Bacteroidota bacterium]